jgi:hypothetical protein
LWTVQSDGPLGARFFEAAQQELAETARLFDLSEHSVFTLGPVT